MATELAVIEKQLFEIAPQWEAMLRPCGMQAEMVVRSVVISCERNPKLIEASRQSVLMSATSLACLGLVADGYTGQGFLIPFNDSRRGALIAQPCPGYSGYATIGARSDLTINGRCVREGDEFDWEEGSRGYVHHKRKLGGEESRAIIAAWAMASHHNRPPIIEVLSLDQLKTTRDKAPSARRHDSVWKTNFEAMARKTPIRRLAKLIPFDYARNGQFQMAAAMDEAHEDRGLAAYVTPDHGLVIDGEAARLGGPQPEGDPLDLSQPRFVIHKGREDTVCDTIEQWRAKMIIAIDALPAEKAEDFVMRNYDEIEKLEQGFPGDVAAVKDAYREKTGKVL